MKALNVLIAEDEENISALVQLCVEGEGHSVVCVGSANEARAVLAQQTFDLVITDVLMPDGDGLALIAQLKKAQPAARILAMSGGGRYIEGDDCLEMAHSMGANAIVMKPFNRERLLAGMALAMSDAGATL